MPYILFLWHVVIALITEVYGEYLNYIEQPSNTWLFNIYFLIELWMIGWAGQTFLQRLPIRRYTFLLLIAFTIYRGITKIMQSPNRV